MLNLLQGEQKSFLIINMNFTLLTTQVSWEELRNVTRMSNLDGPASVYNFHFWILVSIVT